MKNTTSEIYEILWFVKGDTISDICMTIRTPSGMNGQIKMEIWGPVYGHQW